MKKKGFTLVELLSVIIILGIVALIATPIALNITASVRERANLLTATNLIKAAENYYADSWIDPNKKEDIIKVNNIYGSVDVDKKAVDNGELYANSKGLTALSVRLDGTCYVKNFYGELEKKDDCTLGYLGVDTIVPVVTFNVTGTKGLNDWYTTSAYVEINAFDNESGLDFYTWCTGTDCTPTNRETGNKTVSLTDNVGTQVCVIAYDMAANNSDKICTDVIKVDTVKPEITGIADIVVSRGGVANLTAIATDATSDIYSFTHTPETVDTSKTGTYNVTYVAIDKAGNTKEVTRRVNVSSTAPTVNFDIANGIINSNGWAKNNFYVTIKVTDNSGHGLKEFRACTATTDTCNPANGSVITNSTTATRLISTESNNNRVCVQATDNYGQTSEVICSDAYKLDKTAPTPGTIAITGTKGLDEWYISNVNIAVINGTDSLSGHNTSSVDIKSITNNTSGTTVTVDTTDKAGNVATRAYTIKVDKTKPTTIFNITGTKGTNDWYTTVVYTEIKPTDLESGLDYYLWCTGVDCVPEHRELGNKTVPITDNSGTQICTIIYDNAGNSSNKICTANIKVDTVKPEISGIADIVVSKNGTVDLETGILCSDTMSGIYSCTHTPTTVDTSKAGVHDIVYTAKDKAGNTRTTTRKVTVATDVPSISYTAAAGAINSNGWAKNNFYVTINVTDNSGHGIKEFKVCTATTNTCDPSTGATFSNKTSATREISIESNNNRICVQAEDNYGQVSPVICSDAYKLDKTKPIAGTIKINDDTVIKEWYTGNVTITTVDGTDTLSGHLSTTVNKSSITSNTDNTEITVTTTDKAGNVATRSYTIKVDKNTPTATIAKSVSNNQNVLTTTVTPATTTSGYNYQWYKNGTAISGATNSSYTTTQPGTYKAVVSTKAGLSVTSNEITIGSYSIEYNVNGGSGTVGTTTKIQDLSTNITTTVPTRTGYTFMGWGTSATTTTVSYASGASYTANSGTTLYAIWKKTVTITFNPNGASSIGSSSTIPISLSCEMWNATTNCKITSPKITASSNTPTVVGWTKKSGSGPQTWTPETELQVSDNGEYDATTKKGAVTYTVTFYKNGAASQTPNGGSASTEASITQSCTIAESYNGTAQATSCSITSPTIIAPSNTPTVVGYGTSATATTSSWNHNTAKSISGNVAYYAITTKSALTYIAKFNANGATLSSTSDQSCTIVATYNGEAQATTCVITAPTITRSGYTIIGFDTNSASTSSNSAYNATNKTITLSSSNTGKTWYAITRDAIKPTMSFNIDGTTGSNGWYTSDVAVTMTPSDVGSGVKEYKWCQGTGCTPTTLETASTAITITDVASTQVCTIVYDNVGNVSDKICSSTLKIDKTKPEINGIADINVNVGATVNLDAGVTCSDATSGVDTCTHSPETVDTSKTGVTNVVYTAKDKAGNTKTVTRKVTVSADAPTITYTVPEGTLNSNGWAKANFYVTINVKDNSGHGIKEFKVCTATTDTCNPTNGSVVTNTTATRLISTESSNNRICVQAKDNYDQTSEVICSDAYKLDKTKPTAGTIKVNNSSTIADWYNNDVTLTAVNGSDSLSGHGSTSISATSITSNTSGTKVTVTTVDKAGNSSTREYTIKVDKTVPTVNITKTVVDNKNILTATITPSTTLSGYSYKWYKNDVEISGQTSSTLETVEAGTYKVVVTTGSGKQATSNTITINSYTIAYNVNGGTGTIGNTTKIQDLSTNITTTLPTKDGYTFMGWGTSTTDTSVDYASGASYTANSGTTLYAIWKKTVTITFVANNATISKTSASCDMWNADTSCSVTSPTITRSGYTIIGFNTSSTGTTNSWSANTAKDVSNSATYYAITKDEVKPSISFAYAGTKGSNDWYTTTAYVTITASDVGSGLLNYKWCIGTDCTPSTTETTSRQVSITDIASTQVCAIAYDNANNNSGKVCSNTIKVDTVKPEITGIGDLVVAKDAIVDLSSGVACNDTTSGVDTCTHTPTSVDTSKAGVTNITYTVKDKAGNTKTITRKVTVSTSAPTIAYSVPTGTINSNGWAKNDFYVTINVTDNSGHGLNEFRVCTATTNTCDPANGSVITDSTTATRLISTESNNNRICVQAKDNYNQLSEVICSDAYKLDKTKPEAGTINITGTKGSNDWYTSDVSISAINGTDALSGHNATSIDVTSITSNTVGTKVTVTTVDKAGNSATREYTIKVDKNTPTVNITKTVSNNKNVFTATVTPSTTISGYSYQWYKGTTAISGATSSSYTTTEAGTYKVKVTTGFGKTATSNEITVSSYTIAYNVNGGSGTVGSTTKIQDLSTNITSTVPIRTGYTFMGWGSSATDTSVDYASGASYTANSGTTLYAIWRKTITVNYAANGGTGSMEASTCYAYNAATSCSITLKANGFTRSNYTFKGYGTSTTTVTHNASTAYTFSSDTTLNAIWQASYICSQGTLMQDTSYSSGTSGWICVDKNASRRCTSCGDYVNYQIVGCGPSYDHPNCQKRAEKSLSEILQTDGECYETSSVFYNDETGVYSFYKNNYRCENPVFICPSGWHYYSGSGFETQCYTSAYDYNYGNGSKNTTHLGYEGHLQYNGVDIQAANYSHNDSTSTNFRIEKALNATKISTADTSNGYQYIYAGLKEYSFARSFEGEKTVYLYIRAGGGTPFVILEHFKLKVNGTYYTINELIDNNIIKPLVIIDSSNGAGDYYFYNAFNILNGGLMNGEYPGLKIYFMTNPGYTFTGFQLSSSTNFDKTYDGWLGEYDDTSNARFTYK